MPTIRILVLVVLSLISSLAWGAGGLNYPGGITRDSQSGCVRYDASTNPRAFFSTGMNCHTANAVQTKTYAQIAALSTPTNGDTYYCSDCTEATPCAGSGTGAFAQRIAGTWKCASGGGGGTECSSAPCDLDVATTLNGQGICLADGTDCPAAASSAFSGLTSGTNTTAAMVVGTGASLTPTGSGTITATDGDSATAFFSSGTIAAARLPDAAADASTKGVITLPSAQFTCTSGSCAIKSNGITGTELDATTINTITFGNNTSGAVSLNFDPTGTTNPFLNAADGNLSLQAPLINLTDAGNGVQVSSGVLQKVGTGSVQADDVVCTSCVDLTSEVTGTLPDANVADNLTVTKAVNLTSNGFVKTSGGDGTLSVDTSTYLTAESDPKVGTVTSGGLCVADGSAAQCTTSPTLGAGGSASYAIASNLSGSNDPTLAFGDANLALQTTGTPSITIDDTDIANGASADYSQVVACGAGPACSVLYTHSITGGSGQTFLQAGSTGTVTIGAASAPSVTVTTDGTGDSEVVLPNNSISSTEMTTTGVAAGTYAYSQFTVDTAGRVTAATPIPTLTPFVTPTPVATPISDPGMAAGQVYWAAGYKGLVSEGATADGVEGWITFPDWTGSDKAIMFPDESGTICTTGSTCAGYIGTGTVIGTTQNSSIHANDDTDRFYGTDSDWAVRYDEAGDDGLRWGANANGSAATTKPMFGILGDYDTASGTNMTANQMIFGVGKGTRASPDWVLTVDAEGDTVIDGVLTGSTDTSAGTLKIPTSTSAVSTTSGRLVFDTDSVPPNIAVGDGSQAIPIRTCWRESVMTGFNTAGSTTYCIGASCNAISAAVMVTADTNITIARLRTALWEDQPAGGTATVAVTLQTAPASGCAAGADGNANQCSFSDSTLTCIVTGGAGLSDLTCADSTHSVAVTAGDFYRFKVVNGAGASNPWPLVSWMVCAASSW